MLCSNVLTLRFYVGFVKDIIPTPSIFVQIGAAAVLLSLVPAKYRSTIGIVAIVFLIFSGANQIRNIQTQMQQYGRDSAAVLAITAEIAQTTTVTKQTKLAVKSDWTAQIHLYGGLSAFDASWSNAALFPLVTGMFTPAPLPAATCSAPLTGPWRIEQVQDITVVCMK